jgi:CBS domain-containing protein
MPATTGSRSGSDRLPDFAHATVADVMHAGVVHCSPDTHLADVAAMMAANRIHAVVVAGIEHRADGERLAWGLITDLDLVAARDALGDATAASIAATEIIAIAEGEPLEQAAQLMVEHGQSHLLVVAGRGGQPVGVVSTLDLAGALARSEV